MTAPVLSLILLACAWTQDGLLQEDPASLVRAVREQGDPTRGAVVFYQKHLACTSCHGDPGVDTPPLGPDLAKLGPGVTDLALIESILEPSKVVKPGFETITIATLDGRTVAGLLIEDRPDVVLIRDPARPGQIFPIARGEIEGRKVGGPSLMPPGLANGLKDRQQFLDLVRYLREIADGGPARARSLRPDSSLIAPPRLPDYERDIDHAGIIASLGPDDLDRGEAIYERTCASCHGTIGREGSMPTSLRFGSGRFRNGSDPHSMYRTLTLGFNQMPPQPGLVPRQKYEVIHYIREEYLKGHNRSEYVEADAAYLAGLPKGTSRGPEPVFSEPWRTMDYGPSLMATIEVGRPEANFAYKGISIRLDPGLGGIASGRAFALYDHDTIRLEALWTGQGFIDWNGINFNSRHEVHPRVAGTVRLANPPGPGWADPATGRFDDTRMRGRDGRPYGLLPRSWARYKGLYYHGDRAILSYSVGEADVLDSPGLETDPGAATPIFARTLEIGPSSTPMMLHVAPEDMAVAIVGEGRAGLVYENESTRLRVPASTSPTLVKLLISAGDRGGLEVYARATSPRPEPLSPLTKGGPARWPQRLTTRVIRGRDDGPFAVDTLTHPAETPWASRMRFTGFDFIPGGDAAIISDWDGDVWRVDGLAGPSDVLTWRRVASGLFQPLGLKVVDGAIYVACRDQIAILRDVNGDGEADFIASFNSDHQVTEHFHEFAMDLQVDLAGNFYYAKGARHGKTALVPQHGTLLRVSKDGTRTDILATGFRAPNGVCVNPDGTFFLTDQEGFWTPKNRINHVKAGGFYGNMWGYSDVTDPSDAAMEAPLCWITNAVDRSPAEVVRVESEAWGALRGELLSLSYGYGKVFVVPHETVGGRMQGGVSALPIPELPTGVMRGRFSPTDGQLYACGMFGWAGNQQQPGGFYRIRATGRPMHVPVGFHARRDGLAITFTDPLDPETAADPSRFDVKTWSLRRSVKYGSPHVGEAPLRVASARLSDDGKLVSLEIPAIAPTHCIEVRYTLKAKDGRPVVGSIDGTIHSLDGSR